MVKKCPKCGCLNMETMAKCDCGYSFLSKEAREQKVVKRKIRNNLPESVAKMNQENQRTTKKCPFCAEGILADAVKCKHCGEWLNRPSGEQKIQATAHQYSYAQATWQLIFLSILTFGIYETYWFYRNWKHFKIHKNLDISPGWRTVGLLVPIYNISLIYRQFRDIRDFATEMGCKTYSSPGWLTFGYIFLSGISLKLSLYEWKVIDPAELLGITILGLLINLLAVWLLVVAQKALNGFWKKEQPDLEMRTKFSGREIALLVIGGIFWFLTF